MDEDVRLKAIEFAKQNKKRIAKELTDPKKFLADDVPFSVFMAGSPGAGKTEFSKYLIKILEFDKASKVVRIDADEIRALIPGYAGNNSHLFQTASTIIVEKMHDYVLAQKQSFILDSTFADYNKAVDNIRRSLVKNRKVMIFYNYQKPEVAWRFTQNREALEGRNISKSVFVRIFLESRETIKRIANDFSDKIVIYMVKKNIEKNTVEDIVEIKFDGKKVDDYIEESYTKEILEKCLQD